MGTIRPAHYTFGSTADLAAYCELRAEDAARRRMSAKTQREDLIQKTTKDVYADLASLIREARFESEAVEPEALTRALNRQRQNGDLLSVGQVQAAVDSVVGSDDEEEA